MATNEKAVPAIATTNEQPKQMSNAEIWQQILADQKFIREARQQGISFEKLQEKYGYKFATI